MNLKAVIQGSSSSLEPGDTIDNLAPLQITIENNTTETYPNAGKAGKGWVIYDAHEANFYFQDDGIISNITTSAGFSIAEDDAGTVNIYQDGADIIIQNKTGVDKELLLYIMAV